MTRPSTVLTSRMLGAVLLAVCSLSALAEEASRAAPVGAHPPPGSLFLTRVMEGLLFGVSARDPLTFVGVALLLTMIAAPLWSERFRHRDAKAS